MIFYSIPKIWWLNQVFLVCSIFYVWYVLSILPSPKKWDDDSPSLFWLRFTKKICLSQASERKFQPEKVKKGKNLGIYHDLPIQNLGNKPKMMISGLIIVQDIPK